MMMRRLLLRHQHLRKASLCISRNLFKKIQPCTIVRSISYDNFRWLRNSSDKRIGDMIKIEKNIMEKATGRTNKLRKRLRREIHDRTPIDLSVPERIGDWMYQSSIIAEGEAPKLYRWDCVDCQQVDSNRKIVLDMNSLSKDGYLEQIKCSPDHRYIAAIIHTNDAVSQQLLLVDTHNESNGISLMPVQNLGDVYSCAWGGETMKSYGYYVLYYTIQDHNGRPYEVRAICIYPNANPSHRIIKHDDSEIIYSEQDPSFFVDVNCTKDGELIVISCNSKVTSEVHIKPSHGKHSLQIVRRREHGVEYYVEHCRGTLHIVTNLENFRSKQDIGNASNYHLASMPLDDVLVHTHIESNTYEWHQVYSPQDGYIEDIDIFSNFLVLYELSLNGYPQIRTLPLFIDGSIDKEKISQNIKNPHKFVGFTNLKPAPNQHFHAEIVRFTLASLLRPPRIFNLNISTKDLTPLEKSKFHGNFVFEPNDYTCYRISARSWDGEFVPITVAHNKYIPLDGSRPLVLFGYGSYGYSLPVEYSSEHISLLERGWVLSWAHVRGGKERGKYWHEEGRGLKKKNTFRDFEASAEYLCAKGYTSKSLMTACTHSAGCLIGGVMANERPDLFKAIILRSPFLDPLATLLEEDLPLTIHEYDEFGDPRNPEVFEYIKSYSPCENIRQQNYPRMLVCTSIDDPRVGYWEAVKWTYLVRKATEIHQLESSNVSANQSGRGNEVILHLSKEGGHSGALDWHTNVSNLAFELAFLIDSVDAGSDKFKYN